MQPRPLIGLLAAAVALGAAGIALSFGLRSREPAQNPDPNHTHADFRVMLDGAEVAFTDEVFMTGASTEDHTRDPNLSPMRKFLHLHDGLGHVVHRHKPGLTLQDFFDSLGVGFTANCLVYEPSVDRDMACSGNDWRMVVNGQERPFSLNYDFADGDKILLTTAADQATLEAEWTAMTDDACLYSRTCPWRGEPPAENCIADPEVPCIAPAE